VQTQIEPINTALILQFLQRVKSADNSKAKEVKLDIQTAKNLAYTLGIVMTRLEGDLEKLLISSAKGNNEVIEIKLDAGSTW
jgi:hypothetical protein